MSEQPVTRPANTNPHSRHFPQPPTGHLTAEEAACLLDCCAQTVNKMVRDGRLEGVTAPLNGLRYGKVGRRTFPLESSVHAFIQARDDYEAARSSGEAARALLSPERPLISPNNSVALRARWALWWKTGRVWPEFLSGAKLAGGENCLDVKPEGR